MDHIQLLHLLYSLLQLKFQNKSKTAILTNILQNSKIGEMKCQKHGLKKDFIFCLEEKCNERLVCKKCHLLEQQHMGHRCIYIEYLNDNDQDQLTAIFNKQYAQTIIDQQHTFQQLLDTQLDQIINQQQQQIVSSIQTMVDTFKLSFGQTKTQIYQKFNVSKIYSVEQIQQAMKQLLEGQKSQKDVKQIIDSQNSILDVDKELGSIVQQFQQCCDQMVVEIQQLFDKQNLRHQVILASYMDNQQTIKQLQICQNELKLYDSKNMEEHKNQIKKYQQNDQQFKIWCDFNAINTDLEFKRQMVDIVNNKNVNHKVCKLTIRLDNCNMIDVGLIVKMINNYKNLYHISVYDNLGYVDNSMHDMIKLLVRQSRLMFFNLNLLGTIKGSDDGLGLVKQYCQVLKDKKQLSRLIIDHDRIKIDTNQKQKIEQTIININSMG